LAAASSLTALSIACCTRDRPAELLRLVNSLIHARAALSGVDVELLIIDDGVLQDRVQRLIAEQTGSAGIKLVYHNKRERPGLLRSRTEALALAAADWMVFIDDDVELEPNYLSRLVAVIEQNPTLAGLGGVDVLAPNPSILGFLGRAVLGLESLRLGRLSWGGFPATMSRVRRARRPFASQRLYGCNMAFRKTALQDLRVLPGFEGYSLYEDAYLSFTAGGNRPLLIDPNLKVRHHHSPASRDGDYEIGRMSVLNHSQLIRLYGRWGKTSYLMSVVSLIAWWAVHRLRRAFAAKRGDVDFSRGQLSALAVLLSGRSLLGLPAARAPRRVTPPID